MDILINNAGIQHVSSVEDFPVEAWDRIMAINLSAVFHTSRLCLPLMKQNNWGRIINVSSVHGKLVALSMCLLDMDTVNRDGAACAAPCQATADCCSNNCYPHVLSIVCCLDYHKKGLVGSANKSAYVAAKHGVVGFSKVLALETAKTGVTVNNICPGFVLTPLVEKQIEAKAEEINVSLAVVGEAAFWGVCDHGATWQYGGFFVLGRWRSDQRGLFCHGWWVDSTITISGRASRVV